MSRSIDSPPRVFTDAGLFRFRPAPASPTFAPFRPFPIPVNFFRKLFGQKPASDVPSAPAPSAPDHAAAPGDQPSAENAGPDSIRVHDAYGREISIPKADWREKVLPEQLAKIRDQPDQLAGLVAQSLRDGFAAEILDSAAHLAATDRDPERGHVLHAAALLDLNRAPEAEAVLHAFAAKHGETALSLANLAKARAAQGDAASAVDLLWRALSLDPNQDHALAWFAAHHRETRGPAAALDASPGCPIPGAPASGSPGIISSNANIPPPSNSTRRRSTAPRVPCPPISSNR